MLDTSMYMAQLTTAAVRRFAASPAGIFLYALLPGMIGIVILLGFLATVLSPELLPLLLPLIIGFNCAAGGYGLIDKGGASYPLRRYALTACALLLALTGSLAVVYFCPWEPLLELKRLGISAGSAVVFTFIGAWLADKNRNLHLESGRRTAIQPEEG